MHGKVVWLISVVKASSIVNKKVSGAGLAARTRDNARRVPHAMEEQ